MTDQQQPTLFHGTSMEGAAATAHVLVLPFPAQGHVTPMLSFSQLLAARGIIVTFLNTDKSHALVQVGADGKDVAAPADSEAQGSQQIRFEAMPHGSQAALPGFEPKFERENLVELLKGLEKQQGVIEDMVVRSRATPHPITCIISDFYFPWTAPLASKLGIQRALFWTSNGVILAGSLELKSGRMKLSGLHGDEPVAGLPMTQSEFISTLSLEPAGTEIVIGLLKGLEATTCILANTFEELEGCSLKACAPCETKVLSIGPIVAVDDEKGVSSMSFFREEDGCIEWLDKQAPGSVLYVSFGSIATLPPQELQELAMGIEQSKQPFLWVVRDGHGSALEGFLDGTRDRGLVVKWAPQRKVLRHVAVGGFLTHCGWNSILEGICSGVPMLCYPMLYDQKLNGLVMARYWELGISISKKKGDVMTGEDIQQGISSLFACEELRVRASAWKGLAQRTLQPGGSSYVALQQFIDMLRRPAS